MNDLLNNLALWFQDSLDQLSANAGIILVGLILLLAGFYAAKVVQSIVLRGLRYRNTDPELAILLGRLVQWTIIVGVILFSAQQVGVDVTAILAGLGILGFTLGFALQDVSKNFIAGLLLLLQQPFELGDTIQVSGFTGSIIDINLRDTEIRTVDGLRVRIPNGEIFTQPVLNFTGVKKRRLQIAIAVAYDTDLEKARKVARETIQAIPGVIDDPGVDLIYESFGDFAIQMKIYYWFDPEQIGHGKALDAGISGIKVAFEKNGIVIPYPIREMKVRQSESINLSAKEKI